VTQLATPSDDELHRLEEELDPEIAFRKTPEGTALLVGSLLFVLSAFHYYTAGFGLLRETTHRGIHLAFVIGLIFLVFAARPALGKVARASTALSPGGIPLLDWLLASGRRGFGALCAVCLHRPAIQGRQSQHARCGDGDGGGGGADRGDAALHGLGPAADRAVLDGLCAVRPVFSGHFPASRRQLAGVVNHLYLTSQGIYGVALGVVATYVFHFVLFGVLATRVGLGRLFLGVAAAVAGRYAGGPAKISIFGSALFGMISGSSVANTVTVGSLTIPMMIRLGYQRHFAAAVESTAATGGQITPPIMGAAAFLMVEFLNLPYATIVIAAIVPAFMHFFGVLCQVHFEAKAKGMRGLREDEIPNLSQVLKEEWPTVAPLFALITVLFSDYTPYLAAFWGITGCMLLALAANRTLAALAVRRGHRPCRADRAVLRMPGMNAALFSVAVAAMLHGIWSRPDGRAKLRELIDSFIIGAKYAIAVGAAAATVGIIVGVVTLTGVGFKISWIVTSSADSMARGLMDLLPFLPFEVKSATLFFTLLMTAVVCILLGCGVPTTATYIIMVTVAAPALGMLGVAPIVAHFFVFYYGVLADITPPVAIAAYAGASMAGADPFKTGNTAFRLALGKVLVPFVFAFSPAMLIVAPGFTWFDFIVTTGGCIIGITMLSAAFSAWFLAPLALWERWWLAAAALPTIAPGLTSTLIGLAMAGPILIRQLAARKAEVPA
jgi:TRAP transporter 4TM/12TM fusion protein